MPRYKLILQDASGKPRSATVDAGSQADAIDLARRKGYQVRQIEPVYDIGDDDPPAPPETAEHGYAYDLPAPPRPRPRRPDPRPDEPPVRLDPLFLLLPTVLSGLALLVSLVTLLYVLVRSEK
jgi:hypothetical protein